MRAFLKENGNLYPQSRPATEIAYLGRLTSLISRANYHRKGIWNDPLHLVIQLLYGSIYSCVKDYKTKTKTHTEINKNGRKWWKPQFQLFS